MMDDQITFKRFDQVKIITTKNVNYLSAPPGTKADPKGIWIVSGVVDEQLLLVKNNIVIKIPPTDVLKVIDYDLNKLIGNFGRLIERNVEERKEQ